MARNSCITQYFHIFPPPLPQKSFTTLDTGLNVAGSNPTWLEIKEKEECEIHWSIPMSSIFFLPVAWHILMVALDPGWGRDAGHPIRTDLAEAVTEAEPGIDWIRYSRVHDELSASTVDSFELALTFTDAKKLIIQLLAAVKMQSWLSFAKKRIVRLLFATFPISAPTSMIVSQMVRPGLFFLIFPTNLCHGWDSNPHQ